MRYSQVQPNHHLARSIECFWILAGDASEIDSSPERILPDGCVEIILNLATPFSSIDQDGRRTIQPQYFLVGQMTRPMFIAPNGPVHLIGIRFHPGGTVPFIDLPMHDTINCVIELGAISSDFESELLMSIDGGGDAEDIAALELALTKRLYQSKKESRLLELSANVVKASGRVSLDDLARQASMSSRQLRRTFLQDVGIGPKLLCRLLRFQEVFAAINREDQEWASAAIDCGYYDQAHLIRDFRQFANETPTSLLENSGSLTEAFLRKNRVSVFSNTYTSRIA
jgi:AraC-like DNA-binding protein